MIKLRDLDIGRIETILAACVTQHERVDELTPVYRPVLDSLSIQKRKIVVALVRHGKPARIREITGLARLDQQNKTSAQVGRLVEEGYLIRTREGYVINSKYPCLEEYIQVRCGMLKLERLEIANGLG